MEGTGLGLDELGLDGLGLDGLGLTELGLDGMGLDEAGWAGPTRLEGLCSTSPTPSF